MKIKHFSSLVLWAVILTAHNTMLFSQVNLVFNPSFEIIHSCPNGGSQLDSIVGWSTPISGGGGNPDFFHTCCTMPLICGIPLNHNNFSYQQTRSGNSYVGIDAVNSYQIHREYIQSKLIKKLSTENEYCVKFYTSLRDNNLSFIKTLGAYFDDGSVSAPSFLGLISVMPQVYNSLLPLNDTVNWMKIEGSFVATGDEEYITIGNFFTDSASGLGFFGTPTIWSSYYYIDDISVIPANLPAYAGNDTLIQPGDSVFIGRQPEIGLDEDCIWFVNGVPKDTVAGLWVWPDTTTTYIVQQTICGNVQWDTVKVSVDTGVGIAAFELNKRFNVYPNPATHQLTIESPVTNATLCITNLLGQEVWRQVVREKSFSVDVSGLGKGVYFVYMKTEKGIFVRRFLKE